MNIALPFPRGHKWLSFAQHFQSRNFDQLASSSASMVHRGSQAGKAYRLVLQEHGTCYTVLALLLAFVTSSRKRKGESGD